MTATPAPDLAEGSTRSPEDGLRDLVSKDWILGSVIGAILGAVLIVLGPPFVPESMRIPVAILGFGMGLLAYLDHITRLIRNRHNLAFGVVAAAALVFAFSTDSSLSWASALIGAAGVFLFFLILTAATGFAGGGDIKLSPIPGAILAAVSPLAVCLWMLCTFVLCLIVMIAARLRGSEQKSAAMAPFMALALAPALIVSGLMMTHFGLA